MCVYLPESIMTWFTLQHMDRAKSANHAGQQRDAASARGADKVARAHDKQTEAHQAPKSC